jgi:hypothetical protein
MSYSNVAKENSHINGGLMGKSSLIPPRIPWFNGDLMRIFHCHGILGPKTKKLLLGDTNSGAVCRSTIQRTSPGLTCFEQLMLLKVQGEGTECRF